MTPLGFPVEPDVYMTYARLLGFRKVGAQGETVAVVRHCGLGEPVRCGEAVAVDRFPGISKLLNPKGGFLRCRNWRGLPHEQMPKGFPDLSPKGLATRRKLSFAFAKLP